VELSPQSCLTGLGISVLCELDVLAFIYRHNVTLASADHIAWLVGYEVAAVKSALHQLERAKLIERSRPSQGVFFCQVLYPKDPERKLRFGQLFRSLESRVGRELFTNQLKSDQSKSAREEHLGKSGV
jgi:hypothetical protein